MYVQLKPSSSIVQIIDIHHLKQTVSGQNSCDEASQSGSQLDESSTQSTNLNEPASEQAFQTNEASNSANYRRGNRTKKVPPKFSE